MSSHCINGIADLPKLDDLPPLGLTERELFTIYMKYSEGNHEMDAADGHQSEQLTVKKNDQPATSDDRHSPKPKAENGVDSSPPSHNEHDYDSSQMTCSTAHTTPLKHLMMRNQARRQAQYIEFLAEFSDCDLPFNTKACLKSLASQVVEIGGLLQSYSRQEDKAEAEDAIVDEANVLTQLLESSSKNCLDQVANIKWVQELAAFTLVPADVVLWSNYRQRVELIARHLTIPSATEHALLEFLAQLHDAYILSPFLHLINPHTTSSQSTFLQPIRASISTLTTTLHSLLTSHALWQRTLRHFRTTSLMPLLRRIQDSPWVRREIEQSETTLETARQNLHKRYQSGEMKRILQQDRLRGAQMLAERRSRSSVQPEELGGAAGTVVEVGRGFAGGERGGGSVVMGQQQQGRGRGGILTRNLTRVRREHTM